MSDDRRLLLAVLLCMGIYAGWSWMVANNRQQQLAQQPASAETTPANPGSPTASAAKPGGEAPATAHAPTTPATGPVVRAAPAVAAAPATPVTPKLPEKLVTLDTPELHLVFSSHGGTLAHAILQNPQYQRHFEGKDIPVDLVRGPGPDARDLQTRFQGASWADDPLADYEAQVEPGGHAVTFRRTVGSTVVTKRYETVSPYLLSLQIGVTAGTAQSLSIGYGAQQPPAAVSAAPGLLSHVMRSYPNLATALCRVDGSNKSGSSDKDASLTLPANGMGTVQFGALDERFFVSAITPQGDRHGSCTLSSAKEPEVLGKDGNPELGKDGKPKPAMYDAHVEVDLPFPQGQPLARNFGIFLGPKDLDLLQRSSVLPGAAQADDAELGSAVGFGFWTALCVPMLKAMQIFHLWIPNWGMAILILTVVTKLLLSPLTHAQYKSMEKMKALQPKMADLKKKHGEDKERLNVEMMKLYSEHKVNPLGGCLPMILQMPIWWALYRLLGTTIQLYREPFLWINDLTAPDPYFALPIAMGVTMLVTQLLSPQMADGAQQKMMMWMMPLLMMFFFLNLPAGLNLYIVASNLLSIAQQYWVRARTRPPEGAVATAGA